MSSRTLLGSILFCLIFALYALAAAPGVYWLDSGELSAAAFSLGIAHPTGFPLFCLFGKAATLVPLGDIAFRVNLLSGLAAAWTCHGLYRLGLEWLGDQESAWMGALIAALLPALSLTFFRQATVAEVYAPSALALVLCARLLSRVAHGGRSRAGLSLAFVLGLTLGLHASLRWLVLVPGVLLILARLLQRHRWASIAPVWLLLGSAVTLYLPVRASAHPSANWANPSTARAFSDVMSADRIRRAFGSTMFSRDHAVVSANARAFGQEVIGEMGPLALLVGGLGLAHLARRRFRDAVWLAYVIGLDALYAIWVNPMGIADLQNGVPLHLALGISAGAGVAMLAHRSSRAASAVAFVVGVFVLVWPIAADWKAKWGNSDGADRLTWAILGDAPARASVLALSDDVNAGLYFARVLRIRPDVIALPRQHLWDRPFVERVLESADAPAPPGGSVQILDALVARGTVFWEEGPDRPPLPFRVVPGAPLPRLAVADIGAVPARDLVARSDFACRGIAGDPMGERACSSLLAGLGTVLIRSGDGRTAEQILRLALRILPQSPAALVNLGVIFALRNDFDSAATLAERAAEIDPAHYIAALNSGRYRLQLGNPALARNHFQKAHELRPEAAPALAGLGIALVRLGERTEGRRLIADAMRRDPASGEVRAAQAEAMRGRVIPFETPTGNRPRTEWK